MWFKTRVGLVSIQEPVEILIGNHPASKDSWYVFARSKVQQESQLRGLFASGTFSNPVSHLAMFSSGPNCQRAIADCMSQIEVSLQAGSALCDLSTVGDASAWGDNWRLVQW